MVTNIYLLQMKMYCFDDNACCVGKKSKKKIKPIIIIQTSVLRLTVSPSLCGLTLDSFLLKLEETAQLHIS